VTPAVGLGHQLLPHPRDLGLQLAHGCSRRAVALRPPPRSSPPSRCSCQPFLGPFPGFLPRLARERGPPFISGISEGRANDMPTRARRRPINVGVGKACIAVSGRRPDPASRVRLTRQKYREVQHAARIPPMGLEPVSQGSETALSRRSPTRASNLRRLIAPSSHSGRQRRPRLGSTPRAVMGLTEGRGRHCGWAGLQ
jgi:hypothetical protein